MTGDFLVWLSPRPIPQPLIRRCHWPVPRSIGIRNATGHSRRDGYSLFFVGHGRGERQHRHHPTADQLADRLMNSLREQGPDGLDRHLGPISGVFVDHRRDQVVIWRDRFGRHPVQMIDLDPGWAITTAPDLAEKLVDGQPRWSNLAAFLTHRATTSDADVFTDLYRIRPSEFVRWRHHQIVERRRWWNPEPQPVDDPSAQMTSLLHQLAAPYRRIPHIIALSAGTDSGALAAVASRGQPSVHAVTFTAPDARNDEGHLAADVADHLDLRWTGFQISDHWPLSRLQDHRFPRCWGPPGHPDFAWKMPFHRWLRRHHRQLPVIYGNGSDEVLWFPPHLWLKQRWHRGDWPALAEATRHLSWQRWIRPGASAAIDALDLRWLRTIVPDWPASPPMWQCPSHWIDSDVGTVDAPDFGPPKQRFFNLRTWRLHTWHWERAMRSLAYESRRSRRPIWTPFLDAEFWELSLSVNASQLVEGGRQKAILRNAVAHLLPEFWRQRPKTGGFDAVVEQGLANRGCQKMYALFSRPRLRHWSAFDADAFLDAYEAYRRAPGTEQSCTIRGSWGIWKTVAAELWLRRFQPASPAL